MPGSLVFVRCLGEGSYSPMARRRRSMGCHHAASSRHYHVVSIGHKLPKHVGLCSRRGIPIIFHAPRAILVHTAAHTPVPRAIFVHTAAHTPVYMLGAIAFKACLNPFCALVIKSDLFLPQLSPLVQCVRKRWCTGLRFIVCALGFVCIMPVFVL